MENRKDSNNIVDYRIALHEIATLVRCNPDLFSDGIGEEIKDIINNVAPNA